VLCHHHLTSLTPPPKRTKIDGGSYYSPEAENPDDIYHFGFGKHFGRTIYQFIRYHPGYIDWCLSEKPGDLLLTRPDLVLGFQALSSDYLKSHPTTKERLEYNGIYPSGSPKVIERQDGDVTLYVATRWSSILGMNKGRSMTKGDLDDGMVTHIDCTVSFTGIIVRTEDWDRSYDSSDDTERMFGFTILPCE
jgi:hypothetical protein